MTDTLIKIAKVTHAINKAYCEAIGDNSQKDWDDSPKWQQDSAILGVGYHLNNPDAKPEDSHNEWLKVKYADGWKYGPVKDVALKEHPCIMEYEQLPHPQRIKDHLFIQVVKSLKEF